MPSLSQAFQSCLAPPSILSSPPPYEAVGESEGLCNICHLVLPEFETSPCGTCSIRTKGDVPPSDSPLLHYCSYCKVDMFPRTVESLPHFCRVCWVCNEMEMKGHENWRRKAKKRYLKTCRICGWCAGVGDIKDPEWKRRLEQPLCDTCEVWEDWPTRKDEGLHPYEGMLDLEKLQERR
jgi:hypothetical protein